MEADGLVTLGTDAVEVNDRGRLLIRNVAMAFDAYLQSRTDDQPTYSKTV
jgi:oxygen-independent coproporphyrinogen-3 oxidase